MPNRDQNWGFDAGRGDDPRRPGERERRWEGRAFEGRGRFNSDEDRYGQGSRGPPYGDREPWLAQPRHDALHDQDRVGYSGQAYGLEGGRDHEMRRETRGRGDDERETWRPAEGAPYGDLELNPRNRGIQEFGAPHDYAYHPHAGHEFDPDYLHWRDARMRDHDRAYQEWRRRRLESYDEDYRRLRAERRER
jgi:hypothetical protein